MTGGDGAAQWLRWGIGSMLTLAVPLCVFALSSMNQTNLRQDERLTQIQADHHASEMRQERVYRELGAQFEKTARVLEGLVEKVEAVDERGSRALRDHQRDDHRSSE